MGKTESRLRGMTTNSPKTKWLTLCESEGHTYTATTTGVTNQCVYCAKRKQPLNFGLMQVNPNPAEFLDMKEAQK